MNRLRHELLLASAGTGKTFRLTNQFLRLLLAGVEPERVLATTFTRKAAGEILDRVLERLVEAVETPEGLKKLRAALSGEAAPAVTEASCRALLVKLTRNLDGFQVRTLDSFFAHLVRLFALDLELPPNWAIADQREGDALRSAAIQDIMEGAVPKELLPQLRALQAGAAGRSAHAPLLQGVDTLRSIALESEDGAWSVLRSSAPLEPSELAAAARALTTAPLAKTAKGKEMANWDKSRRKILSAIETESWKDVLEGGLGAASLAEEPIYCRKPLESELLAALGPLVAHAQSQVLNQLVARNEALRALLTRFERCYSARKREAGLYEFGDLPLVLAPHTARARLFDEREADLWFRLDGRIDHLLLDEFQDTAPVQWRFLAPLAREITSSAEGARSFFCVGDPKQSIYGFRQAEPKLLQNMESLLPGLRAERMQKSYRSSSIVLDLVNRIFGHLPTNAALQGTDSAPYQAAAAAWDAEFKRHEAAHSLPGIATILQARKPAEGEAKNAPALRCAVQRVAKILEEAAHVEIGVLTRVNRHIPGLIHALRQRGIDASGEGGSPLTDSDAVNVYLSLLHLADHPGDRAAAFHVATSPLGGYVGLPAEADAATVRSRARDFRRELLQAGLGEATEKIALRIQSDRSAVWSEWDKTRFAQLVDQAHAFEGHLSVRTSDFIDHLRTHRVEAPGGARVRVMTVHASKGLEFDAVVLPELDSPLVGKRDAYLTHRPDPTGLIQAVMLSPGKQHLTLSPALEELYAVATSKAVGDSLCSLYVAMTRAKRRVELVLPWVDPAKDKAAAAPTYASLVRAALEPERLLANDPEGALWRSAGNAPADAWAADAGMQEAKPALPEPELRLAKSDALRFTLRGRASGQEGGSKTTVLELLNPALGTEVGTLVHAALEACEWIEECPTGGFPLAARGASQPAVQAARAILERAFIATEIRDALSRRACSAPPAADVRVEREYAFSLLLDEEGGPPRFWNGAIDRLVVAEDNGRAIWAEVLDYKSDAVTEETLHERCEYYRPQLSVYARVVARQTGLELHQIHLRLAFLTIGRVVDLSLR